MKGAPAGEGQAAASWQDGAAGRKQPRQTTNTCELQLMKGGYMYVLDIGAFATASGAARDPLWGRRGPLRPRNRLELESQKHATGANRTLSAERIGRQPNAGGKDDPKESYSVSDVGVQYAPAMATQVRAPVRPTLPDCHNVGSRALAPRAT